MEMIVASVIVENMVNRVFRHHRANVQRLTADIVNGGIKLEQTPPAAAADCAFFYCTVIWLQVTINDAIGLQIIAYNHQVGQFLAGEGAGANLSGQGVIPRQAFKTECCYHCANPGGKRFAAGEIGQAGTMAAERAAAVSFTIEIIKMPEVF